VTDTHAHLDYLGPQELDQALTASRHFQAILTIGTDPARNRQAMEIAKQNGNIYAAVGLHPTEANLLSPELEADLEDLARHPKVRAIGETGLDFYWTPQTRIAQYKALEFQAQIAQKLDLPLIFHVRGKEDDAAEAELANWLALNRPAKFVLHAFGGHPGLMEIGLQLGAYFSFAGPLTYKKNQVLRDAAKALPPEKLLVETDTPFLPPEPFRGKRNHPALVQYTLATLADVRGLSAAEMEKITDENAKRCFHF